MKSLTLCGFLTGLLMSTGWAIPETIVFMPTANRNTPHSLFLMSEQYAVPRYYKETRTRCFYTQLLLTDRLDFGVDVIGLDNTATRQTVGNLRYVFAPETERMPGFALGVQNVGNNLTPTYYLVGTRTTEWGRFHAGVFRQGNQTGWASAYQASISNWFDLSIEYFRLPSGEAYTSFGIGRQINDMTYLGVYYSRHNLTRDADLFGVYVAFTPFRLF